jgi:hypothetical protein
MDLEGRVYALERQTRTYKRATVFLAVLLCAVVVGGATKPVERTVRCRTIEFVSDKGEKLMTLQAQDFIDGSSLSFIDATGQEFFFVTPGIMRLNYPMRKGGGSFIWAGPELTGHGVIQIIGMERNDEGRSKSVIEMGADFQGNGSISLRKRLSDDRILSLGGDYLAHRDVDMKDWPLLGGQVEFYDREGNVHFITASMLKQE